MTFCEVINLVGLETTPDTITSHAGLTLSGEFAEEIGLPDLVDSHLPLPGSGAGYRPSAFVMPLLLMLNGGGRSLEDPLEISCTRLLQWLSVPLGTGIGVSGQIPGPDGRHRVAFRVDRCPPTAKTALRTHRPETDQNQSPDFGWYVVY